MKRLSILIVPLVLSAQGTTLQTHTELSYIQTGGNTDTKTFGLNFRGEKNLDHQKISLSIDFAYAQSNDVETKNSFLGELNYQYFLDLSMSLAYLLGYKNDRFSGFDYQLYTGPGFEWSILKSERTKLNTTFYTLYSKDRSVQKSDNYFSLRAGLLYSHKMTQTLTFQEDINIRSRADELQNYFFYSKSSLYSKINSSLSLGVSYKINYTNQPPQNRKRTDTTFLVSLVLDW